MSTLFATGLAFYLSGCGETPSAVGNRNATAGGTGEARVRVNMLPLSIPPPPPPAPARRNIWSAYTVTPRRETPPGAATQQLWQRLH
ncbi:MAG: hypothetical protein LBU79_02780 [Planctomycetota bacterium]|nr:hypothetical protein [Planctomycetota bacterium]